MFASFIIIMVIIFDVVTVITKEMNWKTTSVLFPIYGMAKLQKLTSCTVHIYIYIYIYNCTIHKNVLPIPNYWMTLRRKEDTGN